jgi:hypothetical protein
MGVPPGHHVKTCVCRDCIAAKRSGRSHGRKSRAQTPIGIKDRPKDTAQKRGRGAQDKSVAYEAFRKQQKESKDAQNGAGAGAVVLAVIVFLAGLGWLLGKEDPQPTTSRDEPAAPIQAERSTPGGEVVSVGADTEGLPEYEITGREDVSYDFGRNDGANRLALWVEVSQWPVTKAELESLARHLLEEERGNDWHAMSIAMGADRDETLPAYAMFEWAPRGDWGQASKGNSDTWAGYELSVTWADKMADSTEDECKKPPPLAFKYNRELWKAPAAMSEKKIIAGIAARHNDTPAHVKKLLYDVIEWEDC